jgi:hypothetical protein
VARRFQTARRHCYRKTNTSTHLCGRPLGVEALLRVDFDLSSASDTFLAQALDGLRQMLGFSIGVPLQRDRHCLT